MMATITPIANKMLIEYQQYILDGYEADEEEWADFGRRAVSALYEVERAIAQLKAENKQNKKLREACELLFEKDENGMSKHIKVEGEDTVWHIPETIGLALMGALGGK